MPGTLNAATPTTNIPAASPSAAATNQAYQIQQLQQEVLELRGLLEEVSFELKRLKQQRLDDYLDLDKRLGELSNKTPADTRASNPPPAGSLLPNATNASSQRMRNSIVQRSINSLINKIIMVRCPTLGSIWSYIHRAPMRLCIFLARQIYLIQISLKKDNPSNLISVSDHQKTMQVQTSNIYFDQGNKPS